MSLQTVYDMMLAELGERELEVHLAPAPEPAFTGHMVRVVANSNPMWYRAICERHPAGRKRKNRHFDTRVKRHDMVRILQELEAGLNPRGIYADELRAEALHRVAEDDSLLFCDDEPEPVLQQDSTEPF
jgi:hypothetical protein